jgi:hypothetical protein
VVPSDIPWHTFEVIERRYKIEAVRFKARDETGRDRWGSDEVWVGTFDANGWPSPARLLSDRRVTWMWPPEQTE